MKEKLKRYNPFAGQIDLTSGNLFEKMMLFTIPILLLALFQLLYSSMDQIVVTNFGGGTPSFDAIGSNSSLINLLIGLFVGVSVGANVVVAKAKGENKPEVAHRAIESAMILSALFGVVVGVIGYFMSPYFLEWMQTPQSYIKNSVVYLQLYFVGLPFLMIFNFGAACLRAMGDSKRPLYALLACGILNVALNFLFVCGFGMTSDGQDVFRRRINDGSFSGRRSGFDHSLLASEEILCLFFVQRSQALSRRDKRDSEAWHSGRTPVAWFSRFRTSSSNPPSMVLAIRISRKRFPLPETRPRFKSKAISGSS
jgi:hypothetical protein